MFLNYMDYIPKFDQKEKHFNVILNIKWLKFNKILRIYKEYQHALTKIHLKGEVGSAFF